MDWRAGRRARSWRETLKQQPYGIGRERSQAVQEYFSSSVQESPAGVDVADNEVSYRE
jgi:hypothetical protein